MNHIFDVETAMVYGVDNAILIKNFQFWIYKNKCNKKNNYDGRYWTYNSKKAMVKIFPYFTERQIERILKNLFEKEVIIKGNYNKLKIDKTLWYAFKKEEYWLGSKYFPITPNGGMDTTKQWNPYTQTVEPLPDNKQDNKQTDKSNSIPFSEILNHFNKCLKELNPQSTGIKLTNTFKSKVKPRWNDGYRLDDFKKVHIIKMEEVKKSPTMLKRYNIGLMYSNRFDDYIMGGKVWEDFERKTKKIFKKSDIPDTEKSDTRALDKLF